MRFLLKFHTFLYLSAFVHSVFGSTDKNTKLVLNGCCKDASECRSWERSWFRLKKHDTDCTDGAFTRIQIDLQSSEGALSFKGTDENGEVTLLQFHQNGSLGLQLNSDSGTSLKSTFSASAFCLRSMKTEVQDIAEVEICLKGTPWYRKCCPIGQGFNIQYGCLNLNGTSRVTPFPKLVKNEHVRKSLYPVISYHTFSCHHPELLSSSLSKLNYPITPWKVSLPDQVKYYDRSSHVSEWKFLRQNYCVDQLILPYDQLDNTCEEDHSVLIICDRDKPHSLEENEKQNSLSERRIYILLNVICLGISMIFLAGTALGFIFLDKQNNHKQTMLFYVLSQFLFYFFILVIYTDNLWDILPSGYCIPVGVLAHFFGISSFTWLSAINFDLWWTFRILQPPTEIPWTRIAWYTVSAMATPLIIVAVAMLMQFWHDERGVVCGFEDEPAFVSPKYGQDRNCFIANDAQLYYFYIPIGILLLTNVIFYSCTSYRLCSLKRHATTKHRNSCQLLLKLFFVMGTVWIFQMIHAVVKHERTWYWSIVDVLSLLQSIAIFVIFICKRDNWRYLVKKFPALNGVCCTKDITALPDSDNPSGGSTRVSRAEGSQHRKSGGGGLPQPSEIIQLP